MTVTGMQLNYKDKISLQIQQIKNKISQKNAKYLSLPEKEWAWVYCMSTNTEKMQTFELHICLTKLTNSS